jgi:hypothetical protein
MGVFDCLSRWWTVTRKMRSTCENTRMTRSGLVVRIVVGRFHTAEVVGSSPAAPTSAT